MSAPGTELQERFAAAFARNGGDATAAAIEAGYSEKSARDLGRRALESPYVLTLIMVELEKQRARAGAIGLNALVTVAESEKAPAAARVAAGRALMDFAGLASASGDVQQPRRDSEPPPDYRAILDTFANISTLAVAAATREVIQ